MNKNMFIAENESSPDLPRPRSPPPLEANGRFTNGNKNRIVVANVNQAVGMYNWQSTKMTVQCIEPGSEMYGHYFRPRCTYVLMYGKK